MERGGPFTGGENQEDPERRRRRGGRPPARLASPEDRLWRHPSEVVGPRAAPGEPLRTRPRARLGASVAGHVGRPWPPASWAWPPSPPPSPSCFTFIDSKGTTDGVSRLIPGSGRTSIPVATTSLTVPPVVGHDVMQLVAAVRPSLVGLEPARRHGAGPDDRRGPARREARRDRRRRPWPAPRRSTSSRPPGSGMRGQVVGSDAHSGVAVISTDGGLTPATFADEDVQQN